MCKVKIVYDTYFNVEHRPNKNQKHNQKEAKK